MTELTKDVNEEIVMRELTINELESVNGGCQFDLQGSGLSQEAIEEICRETSISGSMNINDIPYPIASVEGHEGSRAYGSRLP